MLMATRRMSRENSVSTETTPRAGRTGFNSRFLFAIAVFRPTQPHIRGQFAKFVDSPYYSESELCGGAVTVSFFKVAPLASDILLTTLHPLLENVLQTTVFEISCLGTPFSWLEKPRNRMGLDVN
jgi:hypothetical protein